MNLEKLPPFLERLRAEDNWVTSLYYVLKEFKWTIFDIFGEEIKHEHSIKLFKWTILNWTTTTIRPPIPIPTLIILMKEMEKRIKEEEKAYKKAGRRR